MKHGWKLEVKKMKNIRENVDEKVFPYISTNRRNNRDYLKSAYPAFTELLDTFQKKTFQKKYLMVMPDF